MEASIPRGIQPRSSSLHLSRRSAPAQPLQPRASLKTSALLPSSPASPTTHTLSKRTNTLATLKATTRMSSSARPSSSTLAASTLLPWTPLPSPLRATTASCTPSPSRSPPPPPALGALPSPATPTPPSLAPAPSLPWTRTLLATPSLRLNSSSLNNVSLVMRQNLAASPSSTRDPSPAPRACELSSALVEPRRSKAGTARREALTARATRSVAPSRTSSLQRRQPRCRAAGVVRCLQGQHLRGIRCSEGEGAGLLIDT